MCRKKKNKSKKKEPSPTSNPPITFPKNTRVTTEKKKEEQSSLLLSLPDELLLTCIARVSRLYYPTLSLVCKRLQSLVASPELYKFRTLSGRTESCLYVCLWFRHELRWFSLFRKPDQTAYVLGKVPVPTCYNAEFSNLVAVGSSIYNIAGRCFYNNVPSSSSSVSVPDCRSHTCLEGPSLPVKLLTATATAIDQKIYVAGYDSSEKNSFQVLDTRTQMWRPVEGFSEELKIPLKCDYVRLADYGGKIAVFWEERFSPISVWNVYSVSRFRIWCAVIALERSQSCEILGKVEWCAPVLIVPFPSRFVKALSATL